MVDREVLLSNSARITMPKKSSKRSQRPAQSAGSGTSAKTAADPKELRELFQMLAGSESDRVSIDDIARMSESLGLKFSQQQVQEMVALFDTDQDGRLTFEDFSTAFQFSQS